MGSLIYLAAECNIDFYYAISPGLDITYSSPKEVSCLKRKLEQVNDNTIEWMITITEFQEKIILCRGQFVLQNVKIDLIQT